MNVKGKLMLVPEQNGVYTQAYLVIPDPYVQGQVFACVMDRLCVN